MSSASYRIRCLLLCQELNKINIPISIYGKSDPPPKTLIISKKYDSASINHAKFLKQNYGTKIILDICDNHFIHDNPRRRLELREAIFSSDEIIASSLYLANVIRGECGQNIKISIIEDYIEAPYYPNLFISILNLRSLLSLLFLKAKIFISSPDSKKLVWFGTHQGGYGESGMQDLQNIKPILEKLDQKKQISLTVVSNSYKKYRETTDGWKIQTHYLPWSYITFSKALKFHDIALIPITKNPFTLSKTANRVTTSLIHELQVIADEIPSYKSYSDYIYLNNWSESFDKIFMGDFKISKYNYKEHNDKITNKWTNVLCYKKVS